MKREELLVNAKPILFNTEMAKAILENRKTVTRRLVKPQPNYIQQLSDGGFDNGVGYIKPKYQVGDILYVRETFCLKYDGEMYFYLADRFSNREEKRLLDYTNVRWKPSIHMPKEAARIFLKVTGVRVERLQNMNIDDIEKEGVYCDSQHNKVQGLLLRFIRIWDSTINKQDFEKYEWYANPYVWVIEFEKINLEDDHYN